MTDDELAAYNSTVAIQEQIKCVSAQINFDRGMQKVCGTRSEIQDLPRPPAPGARNKGANPRFLNDIETLITSLFRICFDLKLLRRLS